MKKILALALTALVLLSICSLSVAADGLGSPVSVQQGGRRCFRCGFLEWLVRCF